MDQPVHGFSVPSGSIDTPFGHTWLAVVYAVAALLLLIGKTTRAATTWLGLTVLLIVLVVYVPVGVVERVCMQGFSYLADTLMYCGAVLPIAGAMPRTAQRRESSRLISPDR